MKNIYYTLMFILVISRSCFSMGEHDALYKNPNILVEHFCLTEHLGSTLNFYLPGYPLLSQRTKAKPEIQKVIDEYDKKYEYFDIYPLVIVDNYKVEEIKQVDATHAYAIISYHQLATRGESWEKIKAQQGAYKGAPIKNIQDIKSKLNLEYDGTRWWIIDPPEPKVSFESMANYYRDGAKAEYDRLVGNRVDYKYAPEDIKKFRKRYEEAKDLLNILANLKNDSLLKKQLFAFEKPDTEKRIQAHLEYLQDNYIGRDLNSLVKKFCDEEYLGTRWNYVNPDHHPAAKYSLEIKKLINEIMDSINRDDYYEIDPISIVDNYKIEEIKQVDATHAYAVISYHQLATRGESWEKIKAQQGAYKGTPIKNIRDIKSKLNLEYDGTRWWIIDPPEPKVSFESMVNYYRDKAEVEYDRLVGNRVDYKYAPEDIKKFKKRYEEAKDLLNILTNLKGAV